jgi:hypothetical protein
MSNLISLIKNLTNRSDNIGIVRVNQEYSLVACKTIDAGDIIFEIRGEYAERPSKYSVQIDHNIHVDVVDTMTTEDMLDRYYWRFMNHHCEPTAYICDRQVIALRDISVWEEITFNYNTVEYDLSEPFFCCCNSPACIGKVRGYKYLTKEEKSRLRPYTAPYLIQRDSA